MGAGRAEWAFVGRTAERHALLAALERSGAVVVVGPAGVGKTRLAREVVAHLDGPDAAGRTPLACGTRAARDVPLGAFAPWLRAPTSAPADVMTLQRAADALTARGPGSVLGVDDAHLLDTVSAALVHQIALHRQVRLVLTVRQGEPTPDAVTSVWKEGLGERFELGALTADATTEVVTAALGAPVEPATAARLYAITRGNALWLRHLVEGERSAGRLAHADGRWTWRGDPVLTPALDELVRSEIGELAEGERRVLELLAYGESLGLDTLAGLSDPGSTETCAERGLIGVTTDGVRRLVRIAHPLYEEAVRSRVSEPRARRLRGELAETLRSVGARRAGDGLRRAVLSLDSDVTPDPSLLVEAGTQAAAYTDLDLAVRLFRAARDAGAGFEAQLGLGQMMSWVFRPEDAEVELARAVENATTDLDRTRATLQRVNNLFFILARADLARAVLAEVESTTGEGPARRHLDAVHALLAAAGGRIEEAHDRARGVLDDPGSPGPARAWAGWAELVTRSFRGRGEALDRIADRAMTAAAGSPETTALQANIGYIEVLGHGLAGRPGLARVRADWMRSRTGSYAPFFGSLYDGRIALDVGRVRTAVEVLGVVRAAFPPGYAGGWTVLFELVAAQAHGMAGDAAGARAALARATDGRLPGMSVVDAELELAAAWVAAADGDLREAVRRCGVAAARAAASGQPTMEVLIRHTAVCFSDRSQAGRLAALSRVVDGPRAAAAAAHASAFAARDPEALRRVAADLEQAQLLVFAADAAAQAAVAHRARGESGPASAAGEKAAELARRCEGARTPALLAAGASATLSRREREVAVLVGAGLSNRDVATRLHVSVRTVESHIYRACARLGLPDREALGDIVAGARRGAPDEAP